MEVALAYPPPKTTRGTLFPGSGYYKFPPETLPQGVTFSGSVHKFQLAPFLTLSIVSISY